VPAGKLEPRGRAISRGVRGDFRRTRGFGPGAGIVNDRQRQEGSLTAAVAQLERLAGNGQPTSDGGWTWAQTLTHCAQSIEYSMHGFPRSKGWLFQRTVGAAAFGAFRRRGHMSHGLAEPIPGAPAIAADADPVQALARLHRAIADFHGWTGALQPHFAYGPLDRAQYELAHAMHLANHLSAFRAGP
jgi:hypothetical protein